MLRDDQVRRYSRHILVPDVGGVGQTKLLAATVHLDVRDPAARAAAVYLAAAGTGTLVFDDPALAAQVTAQNPDVHVRASNADLGSDTSHVPHEQCSIAAIELEPRPGSGHADALVRGGVAACRLIHGLVQR